MSTTTDKPTIEEIRKIHNQQPPSTITKREWEHVDFLLAEVKRLIAENENAVNFIRHRGYRRCDIAACNCLSWHGGHAEDQLAEISNEIGDKIQGKTILQTIRERGLMVDRHYVTGANFGWNCGQSDDWDKFKTAMEARGKKYE